MRLSRLLPLTLGLVTGGLGQSSVNIFAVNYQIVAYEKASDKAATTYLVGCPRDFHPSKCPFAQPYTLIEEPKTLRFEFTAPLPDSSSVIQSMTLRCKFEDTTSMDCTATGLSGGPSPTSHVTTREKITYSGKEASVLFREIPLVTNSKLLLTYTLGQTSSSATAGSAKTSVAPITPPTRTPIPGTSTTSTSTSSVPKLAGGDSSLIVPSQSPTTSTTSSSGTVLGGSVPSNSSTGILSAASQYGNGAYERLVVCGLVLAAAVVVGNL